jgi:MoCo/4Fe-4S cofactor protein with predicted Tat translocation signal
MKPDNETGVPPQWRSLEERAQTPEALENIEHEFPWRTSEEVEGIDRREFWKVMGAALTMAGLVGCERQPTEKIVPYVNQPTEIVQGKAIYFATAMPFLDGALGLLVKSHMGHPVKVEGNPRHPASLGATDAFAQASLMSLYDPDRSATVMHNGLISDWTTFLAWLEAALSEQAANGGARLRLLTDSVISPTLGAQIGALLERYPSAKWHQWEPAGRDNARLGAQMAFGRFVNTIYRFDRAARIFSLDADFLFSGPAWPRYARDFSKRRGSRAGVDGMSRLYVAETNFSSTGATADHRFRVKPGEMEAVLRGVAQAVGAPGGAPAPAQHAKWIAAVAKDLAAHRGASVVLVGDQQPPALHALGHAINGALGNLGATVVYTESNEVKPVHQTASLGELVDDMKAGRVDMLVMTGVNPAYDAPADFGFSDAVQKVRYKVQHGLYNDETGVLCEWHIPSTHFLEEWSDCLAYDGAASIVQPLIAPLYQGRSRHEILAAMLGQADVPPYEIVKSYWRRRKPAGDFESLWYAALRDGVVEGTAFPTLTLAPRAPETTPAAPDEGGLEIQFRPDPTIWDGRFASNPYLQELPKPTTKLTWDAVALIGTATANRIKTYSGGVVELDFRGRKTKFPLWVQPGHADDCITVMLGYGRKRAGRTGKVGFDVYPIRPSDALWSGAGLALRPTGEFFELATTQTSNGMAGRYPVRMGTLARYKEDPEFAHKQPFEEPLPPSLTIYKPWDYTGYKWGMSIDLNACVGCNACVAACNMENNIAVVGKHQVFRGRIMHWLRIDRYYAGDTDAPKLYFEPVPCMQCENAPCELVCPVGATNHSSEGINQMVYNRCVGTRYCSNNCPYKVRRFNFYLFTDWKDASLELMRNPEVTPRSRGVMEKCTYCIQRIEAAKIKSEIENRTVRDGEIQTACQQACPTEAIVFGNLGDKGSRLVQLKREPLDYSLLGELNTRPRTTHLARVLNLNPEIERELS